MDNVAILVGIIFLILGIEILRLRKKNSDLVDTKVLNAQLKDTNKELQSDLIDIQEELGLEREKNRTLLSQKKSSETRLGQISEHLVPFLENCKHDPKNMHFLGNPIDYVIFDFDQGSITFLEVKSGNSKASKRQKTVKNIIKSGRIYYEEIRINERGVKNRTIGYEEPKMFQPPIIKDLSNTIKFNDGMDDEQD